MSRQTALLYDDEPLRFGAAFAASSLRRGGGASVGPLRRVEDYDPPPLPGSDWVRIAPRVSGICASDLAAVQGRSSRWFQPIVSLPFVPGHEVVADHEGRRVVLEPVLGCAARGIQPVCAPCSRGELGNCERLAQGCVEPGLQSGFCESTGGGWSTTMVAHPSQLHEVPDDLDDDAAVMVEPTACALHGALRAAVSPGEAVAVIGAGTMGLGVVAALARWTPPATLLVGAKHTHQRRLAVELAGSVRTTAAEPSELCRAARRLTGSLLIGEGPNQRVAGGVDATIDCVGTAESLRSALAITRPRGRVVLVGMPGSTTLDLTPLWQREIQVSGAYTYGTETIAGSRIRTFDAAMELVASAGLGRLVSARYPLERATDAIVHAADAGRRGATKVAFETNTDIRTTGAGS